MVPTVGSSRGAVSNERDTPVLARMYVDATTVSVDGRPEQTAAVDARRTCKLARSESMWLYRVTSLIRNPDPP